MTVSGFYAHPMKRAGDLLEAPQAKETRTDANIPSLAHLCSLSIKASLLELSQKNYVPDELKNRYDKISIGDAMLLLAAHKGNVRTAHMALLDGFNASMGTYGADGMTPLHIAITRGEESFVKFLIERGAPVNAVGGCGEAPLHMAARQGTVGMMKLLLLGRAHPAMKGKLNETSLHVAARHNNVKAIAMLIAVNADKEAKTLGGYTPLHSAAASGALDAVKILLNNHAQLEAKDDVFGRTPLLWAVYERKNSVVEELLRRGAQKDGQDRFFMGPLDAAAELGFEEIVKTLITHNAPVNRPGWQGWTALHWAAQKGRHEIVQYLLAHGALFDLQDYSGETPLHCAAQEGHCDVMRLLLAAGAKRNVLDKKYRTPRDLAFEYKKLEAASLLGA